MANKCDYKGCDREAISCGNTLFDENGHDYEICICNHHLFKFISEFEGVKSPAECKHTWEVVDVGVVVCSKCQTMRETTMEDEL